MEKEHKMAMMMSSKFVCEICNKRFPCGKSLGGHLRSHRIGAGMVEEDCSRAREFSNYDKELCPEVGGSSGYGLRTNPKKTRRFRDSSSVDFRHQSCGNVCKECGKEFQSIKALCGHMACHSEKEKASDCLEEEDEDDDDDDAEEDDEEDDDEDDGDDYVEDEEEEEDGEEDIIDQLARQDKNFKPLMDSDESSEYSSPSEIGDEQEELAKCLMMLSRDNRRRKIPNSKGSLVLDSKSSPIRVRVRAMEGLDSVSKFDEATGIKKSQNRDSKLKSAENIKSEYGHLMYDEDSNSSTDKQVKIKEFVKPGRVRNIAGAAAHSGKKLEKKTDYPARRKRVRHNSDSPEVVSPYAKGNGFSTFTDIKQKHQCDVCYKLFDSRKALSGHKSASSCYRKVPTFCPEPSREISSRPRDSRKLNSDSKKKQVSTKRSYRHECPICFRVFKSGQALGGHKRSHFLGSSEDRTVTIEGRDIKRVQGLIDLNLPAPLEEDVSEQCRFVLC